MRKSVIRMSSKRMRHALTSCLLIGWFRIGLRMLVLSGVFVALMSKSLLGRMGVAWRRAA